MVPVHNQWTCYNVKEIPGFLLLGQMDAGGFGSNGNAMLVQSCNQDLPHVLVVGIKVEHVPHHVSQALVWKFLAR